MYTYQALVTKIYDADTITVDIDLGFNVQLHDVKLRLCGIDAPEVRGEERPEGIAARDWLRERLLLRTVTIETIRDRTGKYGRYLAIVHHDGINYNQALIDEGLAEINYYGDTVPPWLPRGVETSNQF